MSDAEVSTIIGGIGLAIGVVIAVFSILGRRPNQPETIPPQACINCRAVQRSGAIFCHRCGH